MGKSTTWRPESSSRWPYDPNEFVVFHILLYLADKATGSGKINSTAIEFWTADQLSKDSANRALVGLEKKNYIVREIVPGKVGLYVFHVQKYVPTVGADEGKQLLFTKNSSGVEKIAELLDYFGAEDASEAPSEAASGTPSDPQSDLTSDPADDTRRENREPTKREVRNSVVGVGEPGAPQLQPETKEPSGDNDTPGPQNQTTEEIQGILGNGPDPNPPTSKFIAASGRWVFKRDTGAREDCSKALDKLLATETSAHVQT